MNTILDGRFRIVRALEDDEWGACYEVESDDGSARARKSAEVALDFDARARALEDLDHPGIVRVLAHGVEDDAAWLVMEAAPGRTLAGRGRVPAGEVRDVVLQVAEALEYAHARGVVHGALDSTRVRVTPDGRIHLTDTGHAALYRTGPVPEARSPEQARGRAPDAASDLYALGALAFELLAGRPPFQSSPLAEQLAQHIEKPAPPLAEILGEPHDAVLAGAVHRLLDKRPKARYASVAAVREVLTGQSAPLPPPTPLKPSRTIRRPRSRRSLAVLGLSGALALVAAFVWARTSRPSGEVAGILRSADTKRPADAVALLERELTRRGDDRWLALALASAHVAEGSPARALPIYRRLVDRDPGAIRGRTLDALVALLDLPGEASTDAERLVARLGERGRRALRRAAEDPESSYRLRRRAGEAALSLGEPVDIVPIWIEGLGQEDCDEQKRAARSLGELGDRRALGPLRELSERRLLFVRPCAAEAADAALEALGETVP